MSDPSPPPGRSWTAVTPYVLAAVLAVVLVSVTVVRAGGTTTAAQDVLGDQQLKIMAPADPGGGWDQTSREMQSALSEIVGRSEVYNVGGAGGTIGLSQFVQLDGQVNQLMVMGLVMVGAIAANGGEGSLAEVTPIAELTTESLAFVVPAESEIETIEDLAAEMTSDLPSVSIAGGSAGGAEQIAAGLLAEELGGDPAETNYIAHAGGGEAIATLLSGSAVAGVSGISELQAQIDAGALRAVAVTGPERSGSLPDVPTLRESDIDVELTNWRGVVAPGGLSDVEAQALTDLVVDMTETDSWRASLESYGWTDVTTPGPEFGTFLEEETTRVDQIITELGLGPIE